MKKFTIHTGIVAPLNISNVDTDAIIPKQFLQKIEKTGFSDDLFYNWRFIHGNKNHPDLTFVLNQPEYKKSSILLTRNNFGCGSSREHAVWALLDYGFKVIIAPNFSDIFYNNSFHNQLLLITLTEKNIESMFQQVYNSPGIQAIINLYDTKIILNNETYNFHIDNFYRSSLLQGLDNIDVTLKYKEQIIEYEKHIHNFFININTF